MANQVEIIKPNATVEDNSWTPSTGTLHGVTSDSDDGTYASPDSTDLEYLRLGLEDPVASVADSKTQIRSVKYRIRIANSAPASHKKLLFGFRYGSHLSTLVYFTPTSTITEITGPAYSKAPDGKPWSESDHLTSVQLRARSSNSTSNRIYDVEVDIEYNEAPVVNVTAPATDTATPTISWTYTDPEGDLEERFRVKIFSAAQYGAGGFDPDTSTAVYDSGEVFTETGELTHTITTSLTNGTTYRAYVKAADAGSSGRYSDWDFEGFTVSVTPPPVPTVDATADNTNARVELDITEGGTSPVTDYFEVQRSEDGGTTWEFIRDGEEVTNTGGPSGITIYDYEMHRGIAVQYRARAIKIDGANLLVSAYSTVDSATVSKTGFWIKSYDEPSLNMRIWSTTKKWPLQKAQAKGIHKGLSRSTYQARSGQIYDFDGTLEAWFEQDSYYANFESLREKASVLLQTPYGDSGNAGLQMWVSFGEVLSVVMGMPGRAKQRRDISIPFVTVEAPE